MFDVRKPTLEQRLKTRFRPSDRSPVMYQKWRELLFLHWEFCPDTIQKTLPDGLTVDTFDGKAYLGIVPFFMRDIRPRFLPAVPGISNFLEMNLRTYVYDKNGTPGVWFYSLDANQWLAVRIARKFFFLPYFDAKMTAQKINGKIDYQVHRYNTDKRYYSEYKYCADSNLEYPSSESLEFFLLERYILFAFDQKRKKLFSGRVHHEPYPVSSASLDTFSELPIELAGFDTPKRFPDHVMMSKGVDVDIFAVEKIL